MRTVNETKSPVVGYTFLEFRYLCGDKEVVVRTSLDAFDSVVCVQPYSRGCTECGVDHMQLDATVDPCEVCGKEHVIELYNTD